MCVKVTHIMIHSIIYSSALVSLDGEIVERQIHKRDTFCSEDCLINTVGLLFHNNWFQHPTLPNVLVGPPNEKHYGHVFIVEHATTETLSNRNTTCGNCFDAVAVS